MEPWRWAILGIILTSSGFVGWNMIRGLRNNNPGNLRKTSDKWRGLSTIQSDSEFFRFTAPKWGIRALAKTLVTYQNTHGLRSVEQIISRWAPSSENDTKSYINSVASKLGVHPYENVSGTEYLKPLVIAIIVHENGMNPYRENTIDEAIKLAMV